MTEELDSSVGLFIRQIYQAENYVPHPLCVTFILCLLRYTDRVIGL